MNRPLRLESVDRDRPTTPAAAAADCRMTVSSRPETATEVSAAATSSFRLKTWWKTSPPTTTVVAAATPRLRRLKTTAPSTEDGERATRSLDLPSEQLHLAACKDKN